MCSFVSLSNNAIGLIAILGSDLPVVVTTAGMTLDDPNFLQTYLVTKGK